MQKSCFSLIGKKAILALTGLVWAGFVFTHMLGNLLIFMGPEAYNTYGHKIVTNPALYFAEAVLVISLIIHVVLAVHLTRISRRARPERYAMTSNGEKGVSLASRTMIYHGIVLLVFIVLHLQTFKYGPHYSVNYNGVEMRDLHRLILEVFASPVYAIGYTAVMLILCLHLSHGVSSLFQSWGFNHPVYSPILKKVGVVYALGVGFGFLSNPVFIFFSSFGGGQ